jgi:ferredoxin-NADP reductase
MKVGDTLEMKGPLMKYAVGENQFSHISMVAGGTGITPMLQVRNATLYDVLFIYHLSAYINLTFYYNLTLCFMQVNTAGDPERAFEPR